MARAYRKTGVHQNNKNPADAGPRGFSVTYRKLAAIGIVRTAVELVRHAVMVVVVAHGAEGTAVMRAIPIAFAIAAPRMPNAVAVIVTIIVGHAHIADT